MHNSTKILLLFVLIIVSIFASFPVNALGNEAQNSQVFISEINYAGSINEGNCKAETQTKTTCASDKWIEIYNDGEETVNLKGWTVVVSGFQTIINQSFTIEPQDFGIIYNKNKDLTSTLEQATVNKIALGFLGNMSSNSENNKKINISLNKNGQIIDKKVITNIAQMEQSANRNIDDSARYSLEFSSPDSSGKFASENFFGENWATPGFGFVIMPEKQPKVVVEEVVQKVPIVETTQTKPVESAQILEPKQIEKTQTDLQPASQVLPNPAEQPAKNPIAELTQKDATQTNPVIAPVTETKTQTAQKPQVQAQEAQQTQSAAEASLNPTAIEAKAPTQKPVLESAIENNVQTQATDLAKTPILNSSNQTQTATQTNLATTQNTNPVAKPVEQNSLEQSIKEEVKPVASPSLQGETSEIKKEMVNQAQKPVVQNNYSPVQAKVTNQAKTENLKNVAAELDSKQKFAENKVQNAIQTEAVIKPAQENLNKNLNQNEITKSEQNEQIQQIVETKVAKYQPIFVLEKAKTVQSQVLTKSVDELDFKFNFRSSPLNLNNLNLQFSKNNYYEASKISTPVLTRYNPQISYLSDQHLAFTLSLNLFVILALFAGKKSKKIKGLELKNSLAFS